MRKAAAVAELGKGQGDERKAIEIICDRRDRRVAGQHQRQPIAACVQRIAFRLPALDADDHVAGRQFRVVGNELPTVFGDGIVAVDDTHHATAFSSSFKSVST